MDFIKNIDRKTVIIVPMSLKEKVLREKNKLNRLIDIKVMCIKELKDLYLFTIDEQAIIYLMKKYNIKYSIAKIYLDNLIYIDDQHELYKIKKELEDHNYIKKDNNFRQIIKDYQIIVYGYDYINKFDINVLNEVKAKIIKKQYKNYNHNIYEFNTIDEEVQFVARKICELIDNKVNINNIFLANIKEEYYNIILRIFDDYNLPIELNIDTLYNTNICLFFLQNLMPKIDDTLSLLKDQFDFKIEENKTVLNQIIDILNKYSCCDSYLDIKEIIVEEFKHKKLKTKKLKNSIKLINLKDNDINDDDYIFLMSFNQNVIPVIHKDEKYLKDKDRARLSLETSNELNIIENETYKKIIQNIKNLTITYKLNSYYEKYNISNLNHLLNYQVISKNKDTIISYSAKNDKIILTKKLDDLIKYGSISSELPILYNTYNDIEYLTYNNNYNGLNKNNLINYIKQLRLSYSSITTYYKCSFRYYIANVLKLDIYKTSFEAFVGSVFHNVLSKCFTDDYDIDILYRKAIDEELKKVEKKEEDFRLDEANKFFIDILKDDLIFIINTIKKQYQNMSLDESLYEKYIEIEKEGPIKIVFNGFIDKILIKRVDNIIYTAIIDYKTGTEKIDLKSVEFGLNMQLPIYLYLIKNYKELNNVKIVGFYLQKILNKEQNINKNKTYEELKEEALKLEGYSNIDQNVIKLLDKNYKESKTIKGMMLKQDGSFYSTTKVLDDNAMDKLVTYIDKKIDGAINNILNANFDINPKRIDGKNVSCNFCKFKDICYKKEEDFIDLNLSEDLSFLGCDNND